MIVVRYGTLSGEPLPSVLYDLYRTRLTGVLRLDAAGDRKQIYVRQGYPVGVSTSGAVDQLGRVLLESGMIDEATFRRVMAGAVEDGAPFGRMLVEAGAITTEQLREALKVQIRRRLFRLFFIERGDFQVHAGDHNVGIEAGEELRVQPRRVIYQGIRSAWTAARVRAAMLPIQGQAVRLRVEASALSRYAFSDEDALVAAALVGAQATPEELARVTGQPFDAVNAVVCALYCTDGLDLLPAGASDAVGTGYGGQTAAPAQTAPPPPQPAASPPPAPPARAPTPAAAAAVPPRPMPPVAAPPPRAMTPGVVDAAPRAMTPGVVDAAPRSTTPGEVDAAPRSTTPGEVDAAPRSMTPGAVAAAPRSMTPGAVAAAPRSMTPGAVAAPPRSMTPGAVAAAPRSMTPGEVAAPPRSMTPGAVAAAAPSSPPERSVSGTHRAVAPARPSSPEPPRPSPTPAAAPAVPPRPAAAARASSAAPSPPRPPPPPAPRSPPAAAVTRPPSGTAPAVTPETAEMQKMIQAKLRTIESGDLFAILGLTEGAEKKEIKSSYLTLARLFHPDRFASGRLAGLRTDAEKIFRRLNEAHATLHDDTRRAEYLARKSAPPGDPGQEAKARAIFDAEMLFMQGEVLFKKRDFVSAITPLKRAVELNPEEGEYLASLAWARMSAKQASLPEIKSDLKKALTLAPQSGNAHYYLGVVYRDEEDFDRAASELRQAVELSPRLSEAATELRLIQTRKEKQQAPKGLLDRFRKK